MREPKFKLSELEIAIDFTVRLVSSSAPLDRELFLDRLDGLLLLQTKRKSQRKTALLLKTIRRAVKSAMISQPCSVADAGPLPPRLRQVLDGLLRGKSEKEIAASLQISANTVHVYVKSLYRRRAVHSRAELLSDFVSRPDHSIQKSSTRLEASATQHQIPGGEVEERLQIVSAAMPVAPIRRSTANVRLRRRQPA